jgi:hypothetical protein
LTARLILGTMAVVAIGAGHGAAFAKVYACTDPVSRAKTLSDTPCPQAAGPTPSEVAASAIKVQTDAMAAEVKQAAVRSDRQLLTKFPDEAAHRKAHLDDLEGVIRNIRLTTTRFAELVAQRKPIDEEAAFYKGKALPPPLQRKIDASDASFNALTDVFRTLQLDVAAIETTRGNERDRLRKLWAGALPGSMGPLVPIGSAPR